MKVQLLHADHDVALVRDHGRVLLAAKPPANAVDLVLDLQLEPLLETMAGGEELPGHVVQTVLLTGLQDPAAVVFRQQVLRDCLNTPQVVMDMYRLACDAVADQKGVYRSPLRERSEARLTSAAKLLDLLLGRLRTLRQMCAEAAAHFESPGFTRFFDQVRDELDDDYLDRVAGLVVGLNFHGGLLASGGLGEGNQGSDYLLRVPDPARRGFFRKFPLDGRTYSFRLAPGDESSAVALGELRDMVLRSVSRAANEAVDHVLGFFETLQHELAFYVGCVRLHTALEAAGCPLAMPTVGAASSADWHAEGLLDPCLLLHGTRAVGNSFDADDKQTLMITGANGGGKSTFLRAVGIATLMTRCGMFVASSTLESPLFGSVYTHFRREEDKAMEQGKFDEELSRMSRITEEITCGDVLLCNESFSATNEREGSQIAVGVLTALADCGVRGVMVTHMFELADTFRRTRETQTLFLQAERGAHGERPFRLREGTPSTTGDARDLFDRIVPTASVAESAVGDECALRPHG